MSKPSPYEYGLLQSMRADYLFVYAGNETGDKFERTLYDAFNRLAQSGWEPYLYFEEPDVDNRPGTPTWVMRRLEQ